MKRPSKRQARRMRRPRARATAALLRKKATPAGDVDAAGAGVAESARTETASRRTPRSRRMMGWRSSPKSAATWLRRAARATRSTAEVHAQRRSGADDREARAASEAGSGAVTETACPRPGAPGFDSPPSLALEEGFAASEADYAPTPPAGDAFSQEETMADPAPAAAEREAEAGDAAPSGASAEPNLEPSAPTEAEPARAETAGVSASA